jgi:hypothetical protein
VPDTSPPNPAAAAKGILYSCSGERFAAEALRSAHTLPGGDARP